MLKRYGLLLVLLVVPCVYVLGASEEASKAASTKAEDLFAQAVVLYDQGNLLQSLDFLLQSLSEDQDQPRANALIMEITKKIREQRVQELYSQGIKSYNDKNYFDAVAKLSEALSLSSGNKEIAYYLTKSQNALEQEAITKQRLISISPAKRFMEMGDLCRTNKEYFKAFDWYKQVLQQERCTAFEQYKAKRRIKAIDTLMQRMVSKRDAYRIDEYHYAQAYLFYRTGNTKGALEEWEKVLALNPEQKEVAEYVRVARGTTEEREVKEQVVVKANALINQGIDAFARSEYAQALAFFDQALSIEPTNSVAKSYRDDVALKFEQKRAEEERAKKQKLMQQAEEERREREKRMQEEKRKREEAELQRQKEEQQQKRLSERETAALVDDLYNKGLRAYALGNLAEAVKYWREILKYDPNNEKVRRNLERTEKELKTR